MEGQTPAYIPPYQPVQPIVLYFNYRSVGVSNFNVQHLDGLRKSGLPMPSVNQIELHPWLQPREIIDYCNKHEISIMGYSPLVKSQMLDDKHICDLAKK